MEQSQPTKSDNNGIPEFEETGKQGMTLILINEGIFFCLPASYPLLSRLLGRSTQVTYILSVSQGDVPVGKVNILNFFDPVLVGLPLLHVDIKIDLTYAFIRQITNNVADVESFASAFGNTPRDVVPVTAW